MEHTQQRHINCETQTKNWTPLWLALVFIVPVVLAWCAHRFAWFDQAKTNQGQLLTEAVIIRINAIPSQFEHKWILLYSADRRCQNCVAADYLLQHVITALGKEYTRVAPIIWGIKGPTDSQLKSYTVSIAEQQPPLKLNTFYIVDPLRQTVLQYSFEQNDIKRVGKAVLADLRKLLKLSKIG